MQKTSDRNKIKYQAKDFVPVIGAINYMTRNTNQIYRQEEVSSIRIRNSGLLVYNSTLVGMAIVGLELLLR